MPRLAYLRRFFLVQRVSFTPGAQVLSAVSSEPGHCKTKDSSHWHDNGAITRHFKRSRHAQRMPRICPSLGCLHTGVPTAHPTTKARRDSPRASRLQLVKDSQSLPRKPGGNFSLNTIYSKHRVLKRQGLIILRGQGSCRGNGSWALGLHPQHIIREGEKKEVCLPVTQNDLQVSTWFCSCG